MAAPYLQIAARSLDLEDKRHNLLKAWRQRRVKRTAELFLAASRLLARENARSPTTQAEWLEAAERQDERDLDWLLSTLVTPKWELSLERVEKLATWLDDPRIAISLVELVVRCPFTSKEAAPFWTCVFRMLENRADRSTLPAFEESSFHGRLHPIAEAIRQSPEVEPYAREGPILDAIAASLVEA